MWEEFQIYRKDMAIEVMMTIQFYLCRYGLGLYQQDQVERLLMLVSTVLR